MQCRPWSTRQEENESVYMCLRKPKTMCPSSMCMGGQTVALLRACRFVCTLKFESNPLTATTFTGIDTRGFVSPLCTCPLISSFRIYGARWYLPTPVLLCTAGNQSPICAV